MVTELYPKYFKGKFILFVIGYKTHKEGYLSGLIGQSSVTALEGNQANRFPAKDTGCAKAWKLKEHVLGAVHSLVLMLKTANKKLIQEKSGQIMTRS